MTEEEHEYHKEWFKYMEQLGWPTDETIVEVEISTDPDDAPEDCRPAKKVEKTESTWN